MLASMEARLAPMRNMSAYSRISYYDKTGRKAARMDILVARPASLRFSALTPTSDLIADLASDGKNFTSFQRGASDCYTGPACPENVARLLPLVMPGAELAKVLLGGAPVIPHDDEKLWWDRSAGAYCVELTDQQQQRQRIWITHCEGLVMRTTLHRAGELVFDLRFDEVKRVGEHLLPHEIQLKMKRGDVDLKIEYREVELNSSELQPDSEAFRIQCPAGTNIRVLACGK